jgi:hypothetical protein
MDIAELDKRMDLLEKQQVDKHMGKVIKSTDGMEAVLLTTLAIPMIGGGIGALYSTDQMLSVFYFIIASMGLIGMVFVILIKRILMELIYIELATRGHERDDE